MKVASIQLSVVENNKTATIDKAVEGIREAKGADLIVLPELWNIGFMSFERYVPEAEDRNGSTLSALRNTARECKVHLHTGSFVEKEGGKLFNSIYPPVSRRGDPRKLQEHSSMAAGIPISFQTCLAQGINEAIILSLILHR
ncbi:MAG: hypothetical protein HGA74_11585, partial [Deltaproteobacteria bacterium]|nr:hypothetical protein [Deltaproteobacteria bacterium]